MGESCMSDEGIKDDRFALFKTLSFFFKPINKK